MVIITKTTVTGYGKLHSTAAEPLNNWYTIIKRADWGSIEDVKNTFNSVDAVGNDRYVFNIKGNAYRLIALILFSTRTVFILWIGTHAEYDKLNKHVGAANVQYEK
jgi:mRNA interferase HigB